MNNFTNFTASKQLVSAYAIYEIIGSEFKNCQFINELEETKLRINFSFEKEQKQELAESKVIKVLENMDLDVADLKCIVTHRLNQDGTYYLRFTTYITDLMVAVQKNGNFKITLIENKSGCYQGL